MQRIFSLGAYAPIRYIIIAVLMLPGWQILYGQNPTRLQHPATNANQQIKKTFPYSWNILFNKNTNAATRKLIIKRIQDSLVKYCQKNHPDTIPEFDSPVYCPCDSLLYNIRYMFYGGSVSSPLGVQPVAGGGDELAIQFISKNDSITKMEPDVIAGPYPRKRSISLNLPVGIIWRGVLAVIDTGIDTTLFSSNISGLLWRKPGQGSTIYNFLPHQNPDSLRDNHGGRHGTLVTTLALKALSTIGKGNLYPKIMVLKALDSNKIGSVFSVSCALSYARQNKATVVNASLGYYGESNELLLHYIKKCSGKSGNPTLIFAAAGNIITEEHLDNKLCNKPRSDNQLTNSRTFFPASWSPLLKHVITITGLDSMGLSCYYQNYSNEFVTLGVLNKKTSQGRIPGECCSYKAPFNNRTYEGSSFATPIACGLLMRYMLNNGFNTTQLIEKIAFQGNPPTGNIIYRGTQGATKDGKYLVFPVKP
ncbi:MAG TPA: S8/S53 family peptidase [Niastella sp.]